MADFKKEVEAVLFASGRAVSMKELMKLLHLNEPGLIKEAIRELKDDYEQRESPLMIIAEGEGDDIDGWKLTVKEKMLPLVQKINPHTELNKSILETLAVITWKQPIVQSDVIKIRTNKAYEHISELLRMGFIAKKKFGRSYSITVTQKFLDYFDLKDNKAIKEMFKDFKDVEVAVKKKKEELEKASPEEETEKVSDEAPADERVEGEGIELEPYIDVLPDETKPKKENEVEVYERSEEDIAHDEMMEAQGSKEEEHEEGDEPEDETPEHEETAEEKTRRMAQELVEDEKEAEEEEQERERKLHPQLEEFIASSVDQIKPKGAEDHTEEIPEEHEEDDEEGEEHEEGEEEGHEDEHDSDEPKPAEEFPGQFDEEHEEGEEEEKKEEDA